MTKWYLATLVMMASLPALADTGDKSIYDSLNAPEFGLPTPYPMAAYQKRVGRLSCTHMINTQTREESYSCDLAAK
jgi:hypothetical protein